MKEIDNVIYFDSDEEFINFCIQPSVKIVVPDDGGRVYVQNASYSEQYLQALEQGKNFVIRDKKSKVFDRKAISTRVLVEGTDRTTPVRLRVENLQWYGFSIHVRYELHEAHEHSAHNHSEIERSQQCGCFNCCKIFDASEVVDYIDDGDTAMCPHCGIDSVIGDASGIEITTKFLEMMNKYWF